MPNKHFCQGPSCHTQTTQDRFLKSRSVVRGRYASVNIDYQYDRGYYNDDYESHDQSMHIFHELHHAILETYH